MFKKRKNKLKDKSNSNHEINFSINEEHHSTTTNNNDSTTITNIIEHPKPKYKNKTIPIKGITITSITSTPPSIELFPSQNQINSNNNNNINNEVNITRVFIPENKIKSLNNDYLGVKREKEEKKKEKGREGLLQMQNEIYKLPDNLQPKIITQDDYVEKLIKFSTAGIIDVPLPLEQKIKTEVKINELIKKDPFLNYDDINNNKANEKSAMLINKKFGKVFLNPQGRKMKFIKQREQIENQNNENI